MVNANTRKASAEGRRVRAIVAGRSGGQCEARIPHFCLGQAGNFHHRSGAGMGGTTRPDTAELLLHLCGSGTTGCHGHIERNRTAALAMGFLIPRNAEPADVPVMWRGRRRVYLDAAGGMRSATREGAPES